MSKCLTRFFHYVIIQYIPFPEPRKYISFTLPHYSLGNCFSSIILTTWILTAPDSLDEDPAVSANIFFPWDFSVCHLSRPSKRGPLIWDFSYLCQWRLGVRTQFTVLILKIYRKYCLLSSKVICCCAGSLRSPQVNLYHPFLC